MHNMPKVFTNGSLQTYFPLSNPYKCDLFLEDSTNSALSHNLDIGELLIVLDAITLVTIGPNVIIHCHEMSSFMLVMFSSIV